MRRFIDVTLAIGPEMLTWPGDPPVAVDPAKRLARGDASNVSDLRMGSHTGTHVDPPFHFIGGGTTVDRLAIDALVGPAMVADLTWVERRIGPDELDKLGLPEGTERLLMRTRNSELWTRDRIEFPDDYVCMTVEGARWVAERGLRLLGTDFLSIEQRGAPGHPVHVTLLRAGVVILEGLALFGVEPGSYDLTCLPLKILGGDGAPARAVLSPR